jgi:hypothetical protein
MIDDHARVLTFSQRDLIAVFLTASHLSFNGCA